MVAQWSEWITHGRQVVGSIPFAASYFFSGTYCSEFFGAG